MSAPRLLVFDLDGTLIDSSTDLCNSVNAALEHVGRAILPHAQIASYIGDGAATLVRRALEHDGGLTRFPAPRVRNTFFAVTSSFFASIGPISWTILAAMTVVIASLTGIREVYPGLPMAVLTNKPVNPSREICDALSLSAFFFQNYGGNSFASKKPDPQGLLTLVAEASSLLGDQVMPHEVVMIGDSDVDVLTARAGGARSIGCMFGLAPEALQKAGPDVLVDHPSQWQAALGL